MHTTFALALILNLLSLTAAKVIGAASVHTRHRTRATAVLGARRLAEQQTFNSAAELSELQSSLVKSFADWETADGDAAGNGNPAEDDSRSPKQELIAQLQQLLRIASHLRHAAEDCKGPGVGPVEPSAGCPVPAPELLQGGTAAFLASILHAYPRGPTNVDALLDWAAAANTFLQEHHRLQRQQRSAAERAADAAAVLLSRAKAEASVTSRGPATATATSTSATRPGASTGQRADVDGSHPAAGAVEATPSDYEAPDRLQLRQRELRQGAGAWQAREDPLGSTKEFEEPGGGGTVRSSNRYGDSGSTGGAVGPGRALTADTGKRATVGAGNRGGSGARAATTASDATPRQVTHHTAPFGPAGIPAGGLPLVRRVLMAQLLLAWVTELQQQLPPTPEVADALSRLLTQLYYIHVTSVVDRAAVEYFHISKAGGTSWVAAAKANGCNIPRARASRVLEFDDDCRWVDPMALVGMGLSSAQASRATVCPRYGIVERRSLLRDCSQRMDFFRGQGLHLGNNEYTLHGGEHSMYGTHICPQFVTVATIREPLSRLVSNLRFTMVQLKRDAMMPDYMLMKHICNRSAAAWEAMAPPVVDNYNIRTLLGEFGFHTPLYEIGEAQEAVAKQLMAQFDLILDLDSGDAGAELLMRSGLGWNHTLADIHIWICDKLAKRTSLDFHACPLGDVEPLMTRQVYDQRWYRFGRVLSHLDQLFLGAAVGMGLTPWPDDWQERGLGPPPQEGFVAAECGLVGLVPPVPHTLVSQPPPPPHPPAANWTAMVLAWKETQQKQQQAQHRQDKRTL